MKKVGDRCLRSKYGNRKEPRGIPIKPILRLGLLIYSPAVQLLGIVSGISRHEPDDSHVTVELFAARCVFVWNVLAIRAARATSWCM